tara:strand:+ start:1121 stop:1279 length:159 start_codon:yes stop_codon:yes gene_type:complete
MPIIFEPKNCEKYKFVKKLKSGFFIKNSGGWNKKAIFKFSKPSRIKKRNTKE